MTPVDVYSIATEAAVQHIRKPLESFDAKKLLKCCVTLANIVIENANRENYQPKEARRALRVTRQLTARLNQIATPQKGRRHRANR